jgi:hypothetical protein
MTDWWPYSVMAANLGVGEAILADDKAANLFIFNPVFY